MKKSTTAIIAGSIAVIVVGALTSVAVASAANGSKGDAGTHGIASGETTQTAAPTNSSAPTSAATDSSNGSAGSGSSGSNANSGGGLPGVEHPAEPDSGSAGDGSAAIADNPAGDKAALDFVNAWISADSTNQSFTASKTATITTLTPSGSQYRTNFSKLATACQGMVNFTYKVGPLTTASAHATAIAADGNYLYSVIGTANARFGHGSSIGDHVFEGSMWSVEIPPPGKPQVVQKVTESITGYNLEDGC